MGLVERARELAFLHRAFAAANRGEGRVALIGGPPGSGKTALLHAFNQQALEASRAGGTAVVHLHAAASRGADSSPLNPVKRLLDSTQVLRAQREQATRLLESAALTALLYEPDTADVSAAQSAGAEPTGTTEHPGPAAGPGQLPPAVLDGLAQVVLRLTDDSTVLITVDNVHNTDAYSLRFLLHLAESIADRRVLMVLSGTEQHSLPLRYFSADLVGQHHVGLLRLGPLSRDAVGEVVRAALWQHGQRPADDDGARLVDAFHHVCGGNPLLLGALISDYRAGDGAFGDLVPGDVFARAVLACLHRGDPAVLSFVRGLAVLGDSTPADLAGEVVGLNSESSALALGNATAMGLLSGGGFRHPRVAEAVLEDLAPAKRAALRFRAAALLYDNSASPMTVARQLLRSGVSGAVGTAAETGCVQRRGAPQWSAALLCRAAEDALDQDNLAFALRCARTARRLGASDVDRVSATALLARLHWRLDPSVADRSLPGLVEAARRGQLAGDHTIVLVRHLIWRGRADETAELMEALQSGAHGDCPRCAVDVQLAGSWLWHLYPGLPEPRPLPAAQLPAGDSSDARWMWHLECKRVVDQLCAGDHSAKCLADVGYVLHRARLDDTTFAASLVCLDALIAADHLDVAESCCESLLQQATIHGAAAWQAVYLAFAGRIRYRHGDLVAADQFARAALTRLSPRGWGVLVGEPISTLTSALTDMGRHDEASAFLQVPLPEEMFGTRTGAHYLYARGRHHLRDGNGQAAVNDLQLCADLTARWSPQQDAVLPWRLDLAEAHLGLGEHDRARDLAGEQLGRLGPERSPLRARAQQLLAAAGRREAGNATTQSRRAGDVRAGDEEKHRNAAAVVGEHVAATYGHRIWPFATEHQLPGAGAEPVTTGAHLNLPRQRTGSNGETAAELTEAEVRVAALAARGYTNRQIATALLITVSTVEQHLTRVYRKLQARRRADLPLWLADADVTNTPRG